MGIFKKIINLISTLILVSVITFLVFQILPGNPAQIILGADADPMQVEQLAEEMGLGKSPAVRYLEWIKGALKGDLGQSLRYGGPVISLIRERLSVTILLVIISTGFTLAFGIPIGIILAYFSGKKQGVLFSLLSQLGLALPAFWLGIVLMYFFSVKLHLFPAGGYTPMNENFRESVRSLILPSLAMAVGNSAVLIRYLRNSMVDELDSEYVRSAYSKGLKKSRVLIRHVLRNSMIPAVTILGMVITDTLGGSIIIESVFSLPGIGNLLASSVNTRDFPLIQGLVLYFAFMVASINFLVDTVYILLDPRIRRGR